MKDILKIYSAGVEQFSKNKTAKAKKTGIDSRIKSRVLAMIDEGMKNIDIHNLTGVSKATISVWKRVGM